MVSEPAVNRRGRGDMADVLGSFERMQESWLGSQSRFSSGTRGLPAMGADAEYHNRNEARYYGTTEMIRDYERRDPLLAAAFNRLASNVVQQGFELDVDTGDKETDARLTDKWADWSSEPQNCDNEGQLDWHEMELMAVRSWVRDGDVWPVVIKNGSLHWFESHRLRNPSGVFASDDYCLGIERKGARAAAYHFGRGDNGGTRSTDTLRVPAFDGNGQPLVFPIVGRKRFGQVRGVSAAAPALSTIEMKHNLDFAKMVQHVVVSAYSVFLERDSKWDPELAEAAGSSAGPLREDYVGGLRGLMESFAPGQVIDLNPGEKITGFSPNVPNPEYFQHTLLLLTFIAANLDLPLQVVLLDPTKTNFSGWRGAIDEARKSFAQIQNALVSKLHKRVYRMKVRQWLASEPWLQDAFLGGVDVYKHKWITPSWAYIEPLKDSQADALQLATGLNSARRVLGKRGLRHEEIAVEQVEDNVQKVEPAIAAAIKLNETYGEKMAAHGMSKVDWPHLVGLTLPAGVTMTIGAGMSQPQDAPADEADA